MFQCAKIRNWSCLFRIGSQVVFDGDIYEAINEGVRQAYVEGYLRKSVVKHPLDQLIPMIIHQLLFILKLFPVIKLK